MSLRVGRSSGIISAIYFQVARLLQRSVHLYLAVMDARRVAESKGLHADTIDALGNINPDELLTLGEAIIANLTYTRMQVYPLDIGTVEEGAIAQGFNPAGNLQRRHLFAIGEGKAINIFHAPWQLDRTHGSTIQEGARSNGFQALIQG